MGDWHVFGVGEGVNGGRDKYIESDLTGRNILLKLKFEPLLQKTSMGYKDKEKSEIGMTKSRTDFSCTYWLTNSKQFSTLKLYLLIFKLVSFQVFGGLLKIFMKIYSSTYSLSTNINTYCVRIMIFLIRIYFKFKIQLKLKLLTSYQPNRFFYMTVTQRLITVKKFNTKFSFKYSYRENSKNHYR
ncbi:hypothetical protein AGLY_000809 [Aphis glycines]|uniref:Uncharacterized protein n=1 Tax=Aphis glycines TaxID=307491 RepID=A0A6G0UAJ9_APHGL|nr:hypothetical protein AGLY_000809 [Aphis glycines]